MCGNKLSCCPNNGVHVLSTGSLPILAGEEVLPEDAETQDGNEVLPEDAQTDDGVELLLQDAQTDDGVELLPEDGEAALPEDADSDVSFVPDSMPAHGGDSLDESMMEVRDIMLNLLIPGYPM